MKSNKEIVMKVIEPQPLTYRSGEKAVLLLHGFTGSTVGLRNLGRYLQKYGYTVHAPLYKGHGLDPYQLIETRPEDWWGDVKASYHFLQNEGFEKIAVVGISLGAVFALNLAIEVSVEGVVSISAPLENKTQRALHQRVTDYAQSYKHMQGKKETCIKREIAKLDQMSIPALKDIQQLIFNTKKKIGGLKTPIFVAQGTLDDQLYHQSADFLYNTVDTTHKQLKWYGKSGHVPTLGPERQQLNEDIHEFLNTLDW